MPCYKPLQGYRARSTNPSGKRSIVFNTDAGFRDRPQEVPCGRCIGCRLERARQWAARCVHEAQLHENNSFLTLTYNDENLPRNGGLDKTHVQKFFKRLRARLPPKTIKYFYCGEYGDQLGRPHYHAIVFNWEPAEKHLHTIRNGNRLYTSPILTELWGMGHASFGSVTFESAGYVARYALKKINGDEAESHYQKVDTVTGEVYDIPREFAHMSRRPAIGAEWFERYGDEVFPADSIIVANREVPVPRYYSILYKRKHADAWDPIQDRRVKNASKRKPDNTRERLDVREVVKQTQISQLQRTLK